MAISKTSGIQLSTEVDAELGKGKSLGAYRGHNFLHVPSNTSKFIPTDQSISLGQLNNLTKLPDNAPNVPGVDTERQSRAVASIFQNSGNELLSIQYRTTGRAEDQPVLPYTARFNHPEPEIRWYETTGGGFTLITGLGLFTDVVPIRFNATKADFFFNRDSGDHFRVTSSISVPDDTVGTRTFRAIATTHTSDGTTVKASKTETIGDWKVVVVAAGSPVVTVSSTGPASETGTIITYTDGTATSFPQFQTAFNYSGSISVSPGWIQTTAYSTTHAIEISDDAGASFSSVASSFTNDKQSNGSFNVVGHFNYTTTGARIYRLTVTGSATFTQPDGTTGTVVSQTTTSLTTITISSQTVDNAIPTLTSWTIAETSVSEDGGVVTATLNTQHAIGEKITLAASENFGTNLDIWKKQTITSNSMTFKFTSKERNRSQERTLILYATPVGTWSDATRVSDTVILTNSGAPATRGAGVDVGVVDEGGSFTFTLSGINFTQENYTWDTTFPAAAVSATSGSFTTPYAGSYYTGLYQGSFTVDTVERTSHYADEVGRIRIYRDGNLYFQTPATLKIKNTTAEPVTLPTVALSNIPNHGTVQHKSTFGYNGTITVTVGLNNDGSYRTSRSNSNFIGPQQDTVGYYANPQPLEGDWVPRIKSVGNINQSVTEEDAVWGIQPSGSVKFSALNTGTEATLVGEGNNFISSIATASCQFEWEFHNTADNSVRAGGTIALTISIIAIPTNIVVIGPIIGGEGGVVINDDIIIDIGTVWTPPINVVELEPVTINQDPIAVVSVPVVVYAPRGQYISQSCSGTTLNGTYHDGAGGQYTQVIAYNSATCGYVKIESGGMQIESTYDPATDPFLQAYLDNVVGPVSTVIPVTNPPAVFNPTSGVTIPVLDLADILASLNNIKIDFGSFGF